MSEGLSTGAKVAIGIGALCVLCCGGPAAVLGIQEATMTPEEKAARAAAKEAEIQAGKDVEAGLIKLAGMQAEFDPLTWDDDKACDAADLSARKGDDRLLLTDFTELEVLAKRAGGDGDANDAAYYWEFRRSEMPGNFTGGLGYGPTDYSYQELGEHPLVGLYVDLEVYEPETYDDESFEGGYYDGYLVVVDARTQERLCWHRFVAENSEVVEFEEGFSEDYSMKKAINKDFQKNFKAAVKALDFGPVKAVIGVFG
ncbi:MAG: hypothetical protein VX899_11390 [Myxococcota bacterium]|nr:hypothetical protein [Myxococcota bacterium]